MTGRGARATAAVGGAAGGRLGLRVQLLKAVRILPGHPRNEDLPSWSFSMAGDFSKSTTCFSRSPEQKSLFVGMKSMAEILPSVPSAFKGISCFFASPQRPAIVQSLLRVSLYIVLAHFALLRCIACHLLHSGTFPGHVGQPRSFSFPHLLSNSPNSLFSKHNFK